MNKDHILKSNDDFQRIIDENKPFKYKEYIVYVERNSTDNYYFGFSVGKKIGNAVVRNHIKRQLKNIVSKKHYQNGFNCIIIVNRSVLDKSFSEMENDLLNVFEKLKILKEKNNE